MASGTYNLSLEHPSSSVSFQGKLEWTSTSNGTTANSSNVVVKLYARKQGSSTATSGTFKGSITIDGTKTTFSQSKSVQNSWVLISTSSKTVSHNANGTKSITIAGEVGKVSGTTLANINSTGSTSITLDTIPRYASIQSVQITDDESPISVVINAPAYNSYTNLEICVSRDNYTPIDNWRSILNMSTAPLLAYLYDLNATELNAIYNNNTTTNTPTIYIIVRSTLNGTSQTSKSTQTLPIINASPTYSSSNITYADIDATTTAATLDNQVLVEDYSKVRITYTAPTLKKGATFNNIVFTATGGINETYTATSSSGYFDFSSRIGGDTTITAVITDSRGNTATVSKNLSVYSYIWPIINATLTRVNNYEDETHLIVNVSVSPLNNTNSIQNIRYKTKREDQGTWSAWTNISNNSDTTLTLDNDYAWGVIVEATDKLDSNQYGVSVLKGLFPLFIDTTLNSVGINRFPTFSGTLEAGDKIISKDLMLYNDAYIPDETYLETDTANNILDTTLDIHEHGNLYDYNQSICTATLSSDKTLTNTSSTYVALTSEATIGNKLTVSNGVINITGVCEYVLISGKIQFNTLNSSTGLRYIQIYKNTTNIITTRTYVYSGNTGTFITIPPQLVPVSYGDKISLYVQGLTNDVVRSTAVWSYLTVEALYYKSQ